MFGFFFEICRKSRHFRITFEIMKQQEKLVYPISGLVTEDFFDPKSREKVPIAVYRGIPYADAERFRESTVRDTIPEELPILSG